MTPYRINQPPPRTLTEIIRQHAPGWEILFKKARLRLVILALCWSCPGLLVIPVRTLLRDQISERWTLFVVTNVLAEVCEMGMGIIRRRSRAIH